jgi:hypothetical protein
MMYEGKVGRSGMHLYHFYWFNICSKSSAVDQSGRAVWGMNCLRSLKHCGRGFESHSRHGCLCAFILCLCCPVCRKRLCGGLISRPRSPTESLGNKQLKWNKAFHGCPRLQSGSNRRERENQAFPEVTTHTLQRPWNFPSIILHM